MVKYYLSALDFLKWIEEIGPYINGGRLRDVRSEKGELFILIYNGEDYWIRVVPGSHILIQREKPTNTEQFKFNQKIRDELYNKKVEIKMHDSDRIIELVSGNIRLIFELFSNGNVSLVKDDKIVWAMFYRDYVSRKIGAGESYKYPAETFNWLELSRDSFLETVKRSNRGSLVKALAVDISLGGQYSTEVCFRAGLKGDESITSLSDETLTKLYDILEKIIKEEKRPNIINDSIFSSIELFHVDGKKQYFDSINEGMKTFFSIGKKEEKKQDFSEKILLAIKDKEETINYINEHFDEISALIDLSRDSSIPIEKRIAELKEKGWILNGKKLSNLDRHIEIDITLPLNKTIEKAYLDVKKLKKRLEASNLKRPEKLESGSVDAWYSKFRWFYTYNGKLAVIGRDNNQNIALIKKYSLPEDVVLHADIFGSPFCVLKSGASADERDILDAATMVASYSSAWKEGSAAVDVYYVKPEQVTLSPPSGESLKRGAFYISGKRNYIKKVPLILCLNLRIDQGKYFLSVSASPQEKNYFILKPGDKKRKEVIDRIHELIISKLEADIRKDDIDKLLPNGECSLSLVHLVGSK